MAYASEISCLIVVKRSPEALNWSLKKVVENSAKPRFLQSLQGFQAETEILVQHPQHHIQPQIIKPLVMGGLWKVSPIWLTYTKPAFKPSNWSHSQGSQSLSSTGATCRHKDKPTHSPVDPLRNESWATDTWGFSIELTASLMVRSKLYHTLPTSKWLCKPVRIDVRRVPSDITR